MLVRLAAPWQEIKAHFIITFNLFGKVLFAQGHLFDCYPIHVYHSGVCLCYVALNLLKLCKGGLRQVLATLATWFQCFPVKYPETLLLPEVCLMNCGAV